MIKTFLKTKGFIPFLLLTAAVVITICSKCSPIYPLNNWDDPNCFFTVGKSVVNGRVMYRDIYEQKGPLLYFLHSGAYLISHTSFIGIWIAEIIAAFAYLIYSYRLLRLFLRENILYFMPLVAVLTYCSHAFVGGDSAEEFCLPFAACCLYYGISAVKEKSLLKPFECVMIGVSLGVVLWVKYTMLGFYIGFIAVFLVRYILDKKFSKIFQCALLMLAGCLIVTLPIAAYFAYYQAFEDLFKVYFSDNIFMYHTEIVSVPVVKYMINLAIGVGSFAQNNPTGFVMSVLALVYIVRTSDRQTILYYIGTLCSTLFFVYMGGRYYAYYPFIMNTFAPLGLAEMDRLLKKAKSFQKKTIVPVSIAAAILILCTSENLPLLQYDREEYPQYRFQKIISQKDNASLLNYGFLDGGFYTVCDIIPEARFFCELNIPYDLMYQEQDEIVRKGLVDFVVTKDEKPAFAKYTCVDSCEFVYQNSKSMYYLYQKR